jgi:hypothetical protein
MGCPNLRRHAGREAQWHGLDGNSSEPLTRSRRIAAIAARGSSTAVEHSKLLHARIADAHALGEMAVISFLDHPLDVAGLHQRP